MERSGKRRDHKKRLLNSGEFQRPDGRYMFKYLDLDGKYKYVYSTRLVKTDPYTNGNAKEKSLREKEKEIEKNLIAGVSLHSSYTVFELVKRYVALKVGVRDSTRTGYNTVVNTLRKDPFSKRKISRVKISDAKKWLVSLQQKEKMGYSTIHNIRGVVRQAFQMAVEDDVLTKNPFNFMMKTVIENDSIKRNAISSEWEQRYLNFIRNDSTYHKYYEGIYILFNTGLRISEFCDLTISDIDFDNKRIRVNKQLIRTCEGDVIIERPKSKSGERYVPMSPGVEDAFRKIISNRRQPKIEPMIDGCVGFLYLKRNDMPLFAIDWSGYMKRIRNKYNAKNKVMLPEITPHICRHTFCTKMAKVGMTPKKLQYIMGHSDIAVTMNTYTHMSYEDTVQEFLKIAK